MVDHLREVLGRSARHNEVPGAQLVVWCDGEARAFEWGEERHGTGRAMGRDSKVPIGSITKTFTATLLMVLVSDGDVDLDEPVVEYLPELRQTLGDNADVLTARHLLSHTGGLPSDVAPPADGRVALVASVQDVVQPPGAGFSYSNTGYAVIGRLVEVVTGMTFPEAVRTILLKPLGLDLGFITDPERADLPTASGHTVNHALRLVRPVEQELTPVEAPAGGLAASAADLVELARMHLAPRHGGIDPGLVSADHLAEMRRAVPGADPFGLADGWGLGLALFRGSGNGWLGHDGTADGTSCHLRLNPDSGTIVALTTNSATGANLWRDLLPELRAAGIDLADSAATINTRPRTSIPRECTGTYVNGDTAFSVVVEGDELQLVVDDEPAARLAVHDGFVFSVTDLANGATGHPGRFLRDPRSGRIDRIQIGGRVAGRRHRERDVA
ncbi:CubicO group peptidase, beta-lactamase class C family [Lentzea xinjiangensis]|uniref:CubicO group peptidase, beta-lactamase class C family n=1 Tax=Lentzea xinjiangensis TaxID=402600 RepID=A0A1H9V073_9PSEU|nr:serine hydrolase domain-containing protein [Lentzea xinjiangensis]SES14697.1 CubicO group peptidase, beta-lactamase class C family [Lentzea xinjiangensis]